METIVSRSPALHICSYTYSHSHPLTILHANTHTHTHTHTDTHTHTHTDTQTHRHKHLEDNFCKKACVQTHTWINTHAHTQSSCESVWVNVLDQSWHFRQSPEGRPNPDSLHFLTNDLWPHGGFQPHDQNHPQWPKGRRPPSGPTHRKVNMRVDVKGRGRQRETCNIYSNQWSIEAT